MIKAYLRKFLELVKSNRKVFLLLSVLFVIFITLKTFVWYPVLEMKDAHDNSGLILNTVGCKIPKLDPYDETLKHIIKPPKPYICKGDATFLLKKPNNAIILKDTILRNSYNILPENVSCSYNAIFRIKPNKKSRNENNWKFGKTIPLNFGVPLREEFIKVQCELGSKNYTQYFTLVPIKPKVEKRARKAESDNPNLLNVILISIDSVSKLNFVRQLKKTHSFLTSNVSSFEMRGYTKVGDNTFPNLVPLLTGHFVEHYWNESMRNKMFFDNLDFIWKDYSKKGYRTFYAEDYPYYGTFQFLKRGFENPPTDYYYRPMALALEKFGKRNDSYCYNDQLEINMIYGYLKDFVKTMGKRPYFAFAVVSYLTHNFLNSAGYADEPTYKLLEELWLDGALNRSITIVFSDHGIRFGKIRETYIGKFEERMPFMYIILPRWFSEKYKIASKHLKVNQNRLITLFDVHATLYHLLNYDKPMSQVSKSRNALKGLSLFNEISEYRTCEMANILPHWCPCQMHQSVAPNDERAIKAATALIDDINQQLKPYIIENICAHLEIGELTDARLRRAKDMVLRFIKHKPDVIDFSAAYDEQVTALNDYLITIRARPGGGMFEGTVRHDVKSDIFKVLGISRINMYGKQSTCINSQILKKFCFCT